MSRAVAVAAAALAGCAFHADWSGTHFACDPAGGDEQCPPGQRCAADGVCRGDGDGTPGAPPDARGASAPVDGAFADGGTAGPDAAIATVTLTFGERATSMTTGVTRDTWLDAASPTSTAGGDTGASFDADPVRHALLRFDLSGAPAGATVIAAELDLYLFDPLESGDCVIAPVTEGWSEGDASWQQRTASAAWTDPGGTAGATVATFTPRTIGAYAVALPPALVQGWIDAPGGNHGVRFASTSPDGRGGQWSTREEPSDGQRPQLTIVIAAPPP